MAQFGSQLLPELIRKFRADANDILRLLNIRSLSAIRALFNWKLPATQFDLRSTYVSKPLGYECKAEHNFNELRGQG